VLLGGDPCLRPALMKTFVSITTLIE
jgi:hypothetical protein